MHFCNLRMRKLWLHAAWVVWVILAGGPSIVFAQQPEIRPGKAADPKIQDRYAHEAWEVIYLGENRIGYAHAKTRTTEHNGQPAITTTSDMHLTFKRLGDTTIIKTHQEVTESLTGELLAFEFEMRNPPKSVSRTVGVVEGRFLRLETQNGDRKDRRTRNWDPKTQSPVYQDRSIRQSPLKPGETREFHAFLPELDTTSKVKFSADDFRFVKLLDGKLHKLLKVRVTQSVNPALTMRAYFDPTGQLMLTETNLLGQEMKTYRVSKTEALKELAGEELDLIVNTMVRVGLIRRAHETSKVVYKITMENEDPSRFVKAGKTQSVKKLDEFTIELTVTKAKIPEKNPRVPADPDDLKPTRLLQSDDYRVKELAKRGAAGETDQTKVAFRLESYVHRQMKQKNFSTAMASAAEVAASLEGDCTEHAMLLAAMLRARQIPSRVAVGLVYVPSVQSFGGHMWTEAQINGAWIPLDATLGKGGIGGGHIKLAESNMADDAPVLVTAFLPLMEVLGKIQIEVLRAE
jgi:hypothetical protein